MPRKEREIPTPKGLGRPLPPGLTFALRFTSWLIASCFLFWLFDVHLHLGKLQRALATTAVVLDNTLGGSAKADGIDIDLDGWALTVNHECTGVFIAMLMVSFVLAYPTSARARILGLAAGLPILLAVNVLRLGLLALIVEVRPDAFFYFHEYVWQGIFMAVVLVGCLFWAERVEPA